MRTHNGHKFPDLLSLPDHAPHGAMRICIVTPELLGATKCGGMATICSSLARALASHGHRVTLLLTMGHEPEAEDWQTPYREHGIRIFLPPGERERFFPDYPPLIMAFRVYMWLTAQPVFDAIIFMDREGNGFYAFQAKKCGLNFSGTALLMFVHGPSLWNSLNNAYTPANPIESCIWQMERSGMELADAVISPSSYMLDWCASHGYRLPDKAFIQPALVELPFPVSGLPRKPVDEVVFFGRLEYRKGLAQFCASLDILARQGSLPQKITFLGKCGSMGQEHPLLYIGRHAENWKDSQIEILLNHDQRKALEYLAAGGRLAVIPAVAANSPCAVQECLMAGIPFLARDSGGVGELLSPAQRAAVLVGDNPRELAQRIKAALGRPPLAVQPDFDHTLNRQAWLQGLPALVGQCAQAEGETSKRPFISVCLTHFNRHELLRQSLQSLCDQDYKNFEIVLADDGSDSPEAMEYLASLEPLFQRRGWKILRLENGYAARARNRAAMAARGNWLLFFDDDNVAMPRMIGTFARAAASSRAGMIACSFNVFDDADGKKLSCAETFLPLGNILAYSAIHNAIGDTASLVRKDVFFKYGGFGEDYGVGHQDFELFLRIAIGGEAMAVIPMPLFWYRRCAGKASVARDTNGAVNRLRSLRPFMDMLPCAWGETVYMAHGMAVAQKLCGEQSFGTLGLHDDPQSEDALEEVGALLEAKGSLRLATSVTRLKECFLEVEIPLYLQFRQEVSEAAREANLDGLTEKLREFDHICLTVPEKAGNLGKARLHLAALKDLPADASFKNLRADLEKKLFLEGSQDILSNLYLAVCNQAANPDLAVYCFFRALVLAERQYLDKRSDVADAMKKGQFVCGLQHYVGYGRHEGTRWPKNIHFAKTLRHMEGMLGVLRVIHAQIYKYDPDRIDMFREWHGAVRQ